MQHVVLHCLHQGHCCWLDGGMPLFTSPFACFQPSAASCGLYLWPIVGCHLYYYSATLDERKFVDVHGCAICLWHFHECSLIGDPI